MEFKGDSEKYPVKIKALKYNNNTAQSIVISQEMCSEQGLIHTKCLRNASYYLAAKKF